MRYRIVPNRPLHFRIAAHLETSGPLGQDARELAERTGESVEDVEATLVVLAATGDVEAISVPPDLARQLYDARFIAEQRRKDLAAANKLVEDHARAQVAAESRVRELEAEVARLFAKAEERESKLVHLDATLERTTRTAQDAVTETKRLKSGVWLPSVDDVAFEAYEAHWGRAGKQDWKDVGRAVLDLVRARLGGTS